MHKCSSLKGMQNDTITLESIFGTIKKVKRGNSLAILWVGLCISTAGGMGLTHSQGAKIPQAARHGQKKRKERGKESKKNTQNETIPL